MDSEGSAKGITEQFRSIYKNVSIQQLGDKGSNKVTQSIEKRSPIRTPQKALVAQKIPVTIKTPALVKTAANSPKTPAMNLNVKQAVGVTPKTNTPAQAKHAVTVKSPLAVNKSTVGPKTPAQVTAKGKVATNQVPLKTTVPIPQVTKMTVAAVKSPAVKSPATAPVMKTIPQKGTPVKTGQNIVKQQTPNVAKVPAKPTPTPVAKEDPPDQSTTTVFTLAAARTSNQLTIEKIDQQQRIPVVLDSNNQVVLRSPALVLQNRVTPVDATQVQSVVIGTSALPASAVVGPQVEIMTSEPLQALQVTQQVTLYGPKGKPFAVDDVKKQIILNKQQALGSTMTNVVSSTTNPVPVVAAVPTQSVQPEQKKVVLSTRAQELMQSPVRRSRAQNKPSQTPPQPQYPSTRGQIKKVSPKREIPMQKVSPLPPTLPPPEMMLANEEEVTTSEELPPQAGMEGVKLIVILQNGEKKELSVPKETLNCTISQLITSVQGANVTAQTDMTASVMTESQQETYLDTDPNQWVITENVGPEPGEILGLQEEIETGDMNGETAGLTVEAEDSQKETIASRGEPLFREGLLAVCQICGYTSIDFNQCQRCNRKIPQNCKTVSADFPQALVTNLVAKGRKTKADSLTGDSPKKKRVCRKRKLEEPVCLTISDDEELLGLHHHQDSFHSDPNSQVSTCDKEPIITDEMLSELKHSVSGGGLDMEEMLDNATPDQKTFLQCRTVRIGSYKVVPKDKVLITPYGIKVTVPMVASSQIVDLKILHHEIIKVLVHFGRSMPVLFFYTRPAAAARICKALKMTDKNSYYFDCMSSDETHRRITFLPDKIDEDCRVTLKGIYEHPDNNVFAELTGKEANDILVKASPKEVVQAFLIKKQPCPVQQQVPFNGQNIQTIMVYPPPPEKGGIPINTEDYACLDCDQFLNDVIIDFYLKYVVEKTLSPEDRARTHVFSSFFYKRLTTKPPPKRKSMNPVENDPSATPAVKRHSRVKSWTKNVNLFTKDFIVIPINENSHWFLAIVCFPGLTGPVRFSDNTPIDLPGRKKKKPEVLSGKQSLTIGSTTITAVTPVPGAPTLDLGDEVEDRDEADGEDEHMDIPDEDEDVTQKVVPEVKEEEPDEEEPKPKKKQREPIKQPSILIFDSLAGASRSRVVATLRDYLRVEYEAKHGETRDFSGDVLKGSNVKCPQQTNYTDCGLYVLQYVEAFFKWPITDFHIPILQVQDWFQADIVTRKRYDIQQLLLRLMEEQRIDVEALNLPILNLSPDMGMRYAGSEDEEEDDDEEPMGEEEEDEDEILGEDGEYNEEMDHDTEEMEEGEIGLGHHEDEEDDGEHYMHPSMEHEEHELDEEEYEEQLNEEQLCEEDDEEEEPLLDEMEDDKMDDISLTPIGSVKEKDLKKYRIPRLAEKDRITDNV